ncbi:unnamed protein product [Pedinophyceae sp. YPF-701]|nr:unnamed protein product [Pedinophyceae sp. YPF-701]
MAQPGLAARLRLAERQMIAGDNTAAQEASASLIADALASDGGREVVCAAACVNVQALDATAGSVDPLNHLAKLFSGRERVPAEAALLATSIILKRSGPAAARGAADVYLSACTTTSAHRQWDPRARTAWATAYASDILVAGLGDPLCAEMWVETNDLELGREELAEVKRAVEAARLAMEYGAAMNRQPSKADSNVSPVVTRQASLTIADAETGSRVRPAHQARARTPGSEPGSAAPARSAGALGALLAAATGRHAGTILGQVRGVVELIEGWLRAALRSIGLLPRAHRTRDPPGGGARAEPWREGAVWGVAALVVLQNRAVIGRAVLAVARRSTAFARWILAVLLGIG